MPGIKHLKNASISVKATLAFGIALFATNCIKYLTTPIFTRILSTSEYGVVEVYNSWYEIIRVIATMTLVFPGILQVGLYEHSKNRWKYLSSVLGIVTASTGCLALIYLVFHDTLSSWMQLDHTLVILMLLTCIFHSTTIIWTTKQKYEYDYKITVAVSVGSAVLSQACAITAVVLMRDKTGISLADVRLWSSGVVEIAVGIVIYAFVMFRGRRPVDLPVWKSTFAVALPLIPHYLSSMILYSTDKIMVSQMAGEDKAGIYSLIVILSSLGWFLWQIINTPFPQFLHAQMGKKQYQNINDAVMPLLIVVALFCLAGTLLAPEFVRIFGTEEYMAGIYAIPPVAVGVFLRALYDIFAGISFFHKKSTRIMLATVAAAASNLVLNYICIRQFGFIAAGYTTMISYMILTLLHYLNMKHIVPEKIYDIKKILLILAGLTVSCMLCNLLYDISSIVRYILVLAVLAVIFMQRKKVINAINTMKV